MTRAKARSLVIGFAAAFFVMPGAAEAQTFTITQSSGAALAPAQTPQVPRSDLFAGVAVWRQDGGGSPTPAGVHLAGAFRTGRRLAVVGDFAYYNEGLSPTVMAGARFYGNPSKVTLFGQFLFGIQESAAVFQPGFGVDVRLSSNLAIRAAFDRWIGFGGGEASGGIRFSAGLVIPLGRK